MANITFQDFTPAWTGFSVDPTVVYARYALAGKLCFVEMRTSASTSNATTLTFTVPVNAKQDTIGLCSVVNNSSFLTTPGMVVTRASSNIVDAYINVAGGAWTGSNNKAIIRLNFSFEVE